MLFSNIELIGTGNYLPKKRISAETIDAELGKPYGTTERTSHINSVYRVDQESTSEMAALAAKDALKATSLEPKDISCIICASAFPQQPLPATAVYVQERLGLTGSGIPAYDVNASCLSHLVALDQIAPHISSGRYKNVLIVSADMPSTGINKNQPHSYVLFGDGAGAGIFSHTQDSKKGIILSRIETYSEAAFASEVRGGLTLLPGMKYNEKNKEEFLFNMDGKALLAKTFEVLPGFLERTFSDSGYSIKDADMIIAHQASHQGLNLFKKKIGLRDDKIIDIFSDYGNMVSASIPFTLNYAIKNNLIHKGDLVLLMGTAAGFTIGATMFKY